MPEPLTTLGSREGHVVAARVAAHRAASHSAHCTESAESRLVKSDCESCPDKVKSLAPVILVM